MWRICFGRKRQTRLDMTIKDNMEILELQNYTQAQFEDLKQLMYELSDRVNLTQTGLMLVLKDSNSHLYAILESLSPNPCVSPHDCKSPKGEGRIIGCATLCISHSPTGTKASVEDVIVSSAYRGQHLGKQLMKYVLEQAKAFAPIELHLTSNPMRVAANKLYQSIGFQKKETNCYQMTISESASNSSYTDSLKQSITYLIGKERAEGNIETITPDYISRMFNVTLDDVENCIKEMGV